MEKKDKHLIIFGSDQKSIESQTISGNYQRPSVSLIPDVPYEVKLLELTSKYRDLVPPRGERIDPLKIIENLKKIGDFSSCIGEAYQLELLIKNLQDVQKLRPDIFKTIRQKIYPCGSISNHFGVRVEARIASSLARKNLNFAYSDHPDFSVTINGKTIYIESTSVRPENIYLDKELWQKLVQTIKGKACKAYANLSTAVSVDATPIFAGWQSQRFEGKKTDLKKYLAPTLAATNLGALIIFCLSYSRITGRIEYGYSRLDSPRISDELKNFLDQAYPFGDVRIYAPEFPGARLGLE
mgnify:CR=1 FL=1